MTLFVDTSAWSLTLRRDTAAAAPVVTALVEALLQGFSGPRFREAIIERFATVPLIVPDRRDHVEAAELRNRCRRSGVQAGTIDILLAQLCVRHNLQMLTADGDFVQIAKHCNLRLWPPPSDRNH
jgi:predicted nucleic acid-binding protein